MNSTDSANLSNLAKIGQLDPVPLSQALVLRMLAAARSRLKDAALKQNSAETRFDCAYTAIRASADIGLHLKGYRTSTGKPGHHQTALQSMGHTLGVDASTLQLLDSLRRQRNLSDYDGEPVTLAALTECLQQAATILASVERLIGSRFPADG